MHKTNCMQSIENIQYGKYLVAYVLKCDLGRFPIFILKQVFNYYQKLHTLPEDHFLKATFPTDQKLLIRGSKFWFGCLANLKTNMKKYLIWIFK